MLVFYLIEQRKGPTRHSPIYFPLQAWFQGSASAFLIQSRFPEALVVYTFTHTQLEMGGMALLGEVRVFASGGEAQVSGHLELCYDEVGDRWTNWGLIFGNFIMRALLR